MALRREDLSPEESARQSALDCSWFVARESLADPEFRARLEASIQRVSASNAPPMNREHFLARTDTTN